MLVIKLPKLPRLTADHMPITRAVRKIGYTASNGMLGTVAANIRATVKFMAHAVVSSNNLTGCSCQSCLINAMVLCQSIFIAFHPCVMLLQHNACTQDDANIRPLCESHVKILFLRCARFLLWFWF